MFPFNVVSKYIKMIKNIFLQKALFWTGEQGDIWRWSGSVWQQHLCGIIM